MNLKWPLQLMFEWGRHVKLSFKFEVGSWSWGLKLKIKIWSWSLELKFKVEVWSESLKLKFEVEGPTGLLLGSKSGSKAFWIPTNVYQQLSFRYHCCRDAKLNLYGSGGWVGGWWVGGWISWEYNQLTPQLKLEFGLGLSLAIWSCEYEYKVTIYDHKMCVDDIAPLKGNRRQKRKNYCRF